MGKLSCLVLGVLLFTALIMVSDARGSHRSRSSSRSGSRSGSRSRSSSMTVSHTGSRSSSRSGSRSSSRTGSDKTTSGSRSDSTSTSRDAPDRVKIIYCARHHNVLCRDPAYLQLVDKQCSCACKYGLIYSNVAKRCLCPVPGQVFDRRQKECRCMRGLRFDSDLNACVCSNTCTPPFVLNFKSCDCECLATCEPPFILNRKSCSCDCPHGLVPNEDMTDCICPLEGQKLDPKLGCICPGDLEPNEDEGKCLCPDCPKGYTVEQSGDRCNCTCNLKCPGNFTLNEEQCLCECPPGAIYDPDLNLCRCRGDQVFIPELGMCECKGADMVFNEDTEKCECAPCPEGYIAKIKEDTCKCICFSESCKEEEIPTSS